MSKDYYQVLDVPRTASHQDIEKSYRWLATKWHPDRHVSDKAHANRLFAEVGEAFDVLSDEKKRAVYDQYGEKGLKSGVLDKEGNLLGGYQFYKNPIDIYNDFFGTTSPFGHPILTQCDPSVPTWSFEKYDSNKDISPIEIPLKIKLSELLNGGVKTIQYERSKCEPNSIITFKENRELNIDIDPLWNDNAVIVFNHEGNCDANNNKGDVHIKIKLENDNEYKKKNLDLYYKKKITITDLLCGCNAVITKPNGKDLSLFIPPLNSLNEKVTISNEGFLDNKRDISGDLIIEFELQLPQKQLSTKEMEILKTLDL